MKTKFRRLCCWTLFCFVVLSVAITSHAKEEEKYFPNKKFRKIDMELYQILYEDYKGDRFARFKELLEKGADPNTYLCQHYSFEFCDESWPSCPLRNDPDYKPKNPYEIGQDFPEDDFCYGGYNHTLDLFGYTFLSHAPDSHRYLELLFRYGADPNFGAEFHFQPPKSKYLMKLANWGDEGYEHVKLLLEHGAILDTENHHRMTALHLSIEDNSMKMLKLLLAHGANPNVQDMNGYTPLHYAYHRKYYDMVDLLINNFSDPNIKDKRNKSSVIDDAIRRKDEFYIQYFKKYQSIWENRIETTVVKEIDITSLKDCAQEKCFKGLAVSSSLPSQGRNIYQIENIVDRNSKTAWVEGKKGYGEREWFEFTIEEAVCVQNLYLLNGYAKSSKIWEANSRVKSLGVLHNGSLAGIVNLKNTPNWQKVNLEPVLKSIALKKGDRLQFKIKEIYKGKKYKDTAISEFLLSKY